MTRGKKKSMAKTNRTMGRLASRLRKLHDSGHTWSEIATLIPTIRPTRSATGHINPSHLNMLANNPDAPVTSPTHASILTACRKLEAQVKAARGDVFERRAPEPTKTRLVQLDHITVTVDGVEVTGTAADIRRLIRD